LSSQLTLGTRSPRRPSTAGRKPAATRRRPIVQGPSDLVTDPFVRILLALLVLRPTLDAFRDVTVGPFSVTDLVGVTIIITAIPPLVGSATHMPTARPFRMFMAYAAIGSVYGLLMAGSHSASAYFTGVVRLLTVLLTATVLYNIGRTRPLLVAKLIIVSAIVPCGYALVQTASGKGLSKASYGPAEDAVVRGSGTFDHPNALATFAAFALVAALAMIIDRRNTQAVRIGCLVLTVLFTATIVETFTRSVWVATPVAILLMTAASRRLFAAICGLTVAISGALYLGAQSIAIRLSGTSSLAYRQRLWAGLLHHMPLTAIPFGIGLGQVNALVSAVSVQQGLLQVEQVHNDYLRVFIETGIVGAALYYGAIALTLKYCWSTARAAGQDSDARSAARIALGACIVVGVVSVSDNIIQEVVLQLPFWGLISVALSAIESSREKAQATASAPAKRIPRSPARRPTRVR
jgi:putative inorganic carbon (HCO3(-)) transporter